MSGLAKAFFFLAVVFALTALAWMAFLRSVVERELRAATGFDVRIAALAANPFTGRLVVRGLIMNNPPEYPSPGFLQLRELTAQANWFTFVSGDRAVIDDMDLDVAKLEIIRLHDGKTNVGECSDGLSMGALSAPAAVEKPAKYLIKRLRIRLGQLVIGDYTGGKSDRKTYALDIDHTYLNVTDSKQLLAPDVVRTLYSFGLHHDVAQLLPGEFGRALAGAVDGAAQVGSKVKDVSQKSGEYLKGLFDKLEQSPKP